MSKYAHYFEITALMEDEVFVQMIEGMLRENLNNSRQGEKEYWGGHSAQLDLTTSL